MKTKSKLLLIVTFLLLVLTTATIVNVSLNFREYSINNAIDKSNMTATIVEDGLTAHMVNGTMDRRKYFIDKISSHDEIKSLWLVRSNLVAKQYGEGLHNENIRDSIDEEVLKTGITQRKIIENAKEITLRVTVPYKATADGDNNCLDCHNVQEDATLGAISMEFDISDMRISGLQTILKILAINLLFILIAIILIHYYSTPYLKLFASMKQGIEKAYLGDFSHKVTTSIKGEIKELVSHMNILFGKMQETFGDIKHDLATFVPQDNISSSDPLYEAKTIIKELSDIYKFKKTIEHDISKDVIYQRIADLLKSKFDIKYFAFYEIDNNTKQRQLLHISTTENICLPIVNENAVKCRAYRTKTDTISTEFVNLCQACSQNDLNYICIPFNISNDATLIISITTQDKQEADRYTSYISSIKNYLEAAKPVIESMILMEKLKDTSLRDGMTGLYNRRFLEEFIDKVMSQALRDKNTYSILMLDVDFFKMVNDTYGHDAGDKVITILAKILQENIRESDLAIRYGGEEFIIMLHNANDEGTLKVANKIHSDFGNYIFDISTNETIQKTVSIGISKFPTDGDSIWKCIKYADTALYRAKNTGRDKIVEFTTEMFESEEF